MLVAFANSWARTSEPHRVTVEEFDRMAEANVFDPETRLELVEGEILEMSPVRPPHAFTASELERLLAADLRDRAVLRGQYPIVCGEISQPQPDLALALWPPDRYIERHPGPEDLYLVVEVADSSVRSDRVKKIPLYGRSGIPEAWLVDVRRRTVEVHSQPSASGYRKSISCTTSDTVAPSAFPDITIRVGALFPEP